MKRVVLAVTFLCYALTVNAEEQEQERKVESDSFLKAYAETKNLNSKNLQAPKINRREIDTGYPGHQYGSPVYVPQKR